MKRLTVGFLGAALGITLLVAPLSTASAQGTPMPWTVGVFGGITVLTGNAADFFKTGWLVGAMGEYRFGEGSGPVGIRVDISYGENNQKEPSSGTPSTPTDAKLKNTIGLAFLVVHVLPPETSKVDLYFGGGGGFANGKVSGSAGSSESSTDGVLSGLIGLRVPVGSGKVSLFVEGKWVTIFTSGSSTNLIPAEAGVAIGF